MNYFLASQKEKNEKDGKRVKFKDCIINTNTKQNDNDKIQEIEDQLIEGEKEENKYNKNNTDLKINIKNINTLNKLKSRLKSLQKKYNTENNRRKKLIKSELIFQKVKLLEQNMSQYQTEKNKSVKKKRSSLKIDV